MAKQLLARLTRPVTLRLSRPAVLGLSAVALAFLATAIAAAIAPAPATCQGVCQCWYCPRYHWIDGTPYCDSSCDHGCAGACAYNDRYPYLGSCSQEAGQGGCGPVCSCRDSDCGGGPNPTTEPPRVTVTPEPTPPPDCPAPGEVREWINLIPPKLTFAGYKPDHPVVVEQDPDKQGFRIHITGTGGRYEHKTQRLEKVCDDQPEPINGTPQPCREWHWECPIRCADGNLQSDAERDAQPHTDLDANLYGDAQRDGYGNADCDAHAKGYAFTNTDADSDGYGHAVADRDPDGHSHGHGRARLCHPGHGL